MKIKYQSKNLLEIDREFSSSIKRVEINGSALTISEILSVARKQSFIEFTKDSRILRAIERSYQEMMKDVKNGVPIYGCNTGYGAQASHVLINGSEKERLSLARKISEGIAHIDVSVGPHFADDVVRGAMLIRMNMLMKGVSAVKLSDLDMYRKMLNAHITPLVNQYGGIGASGDLAHNCRVVSALRQLKGIRVKDKNGNVRDAKDVLQEEGIEPLVLDPKAGLGLVNGDNFSSSLATLLAHDTLQALLISFVISAGMVEVLRGTDRSFHPLLSKVRPHEGQIEAAYLLRSLVEGSELAFQEMTGHKKREKGVKVQDGYSLRCMPQYYGVSIERLKSIFDVLAININSVSDNPLWVPEESATEGEKPWQWLSGGNFLAMHVSEAMDGLRKIMTYIVKLNDRHLARLVNPNENHGLAANLSDKKALTQCSFKGVQIQSGMFEVYSSLLSIPVNTFFGTHEEGNQDITSHALTSGILGLENLRLVRYALSQNAIAFVQAVDLRGGPKNLSKNTRPLYEFVRKYTSYVDVERPLFGEIEQIYESISSGELNSYLRENVFSAISSASKD